MEKIKVFEIEIGGVKTSITNLGDVTDALKLINKESKKADFGTKKFNDLQNQLGTLKEVQREFRAETRAVGRELEATKYPTDSLRGLELQYIKTRQQIKNLSKEERESDFGKQLIASAAATKKELNELNLSMNDGRTNVGLYTKSILEAANTQNGLVAQLAQLENEFKQLPKSIRESTEAQNSYNESVNELKTQINDLSDTTGKKFEDFQETLIGKLENAEGAVGDFIGGIKGLGRSLKALLANPVVAFLSGVAFILGAVFNAFTQTENGANAMAKVTGFLSGALDVLVGLLASAAEGLISFAEDPIEGLKNLGLTIVNDIIGRLKGLIEIIGSAKDALVSIATFDTDGLASANERAAEGFKKVTSGATELVEKLKDTTKEIVDNGNAFAALNAERRRLVKVNRDLTVSLEKLTTQEAILSATADDTTKSLAVREAAQIEATKVREQAANKEIAIAKNNLSTLTAEINLRRAQKKEVESLADQQLGAIQAVLQAERAATLARLDSERTVGELRRDTAERDLDILLDGLDNQKTINERIIANDKLPLEQRIKLADETQKLADKSFDEQIKIIQSTTDAQINANDLLNESDAVRLTQRINALGVDDIIAGRLLEVIRDQRTAVQDLIEVREDLNEAVIANKNDSVEAERNNQLAALIASSKKSAEQIAFDKEIIDKDSTIKLLNQRLQLEQLSEKEASELRLKILEEESAKRKAIADNNLKLTIDEIEKVGLLRLNEIQRNTDNQKEYQETRKAIELETELAIIEAKINASEQGSIEQLKLQQDLEDKRAEAAIAANEKIKLSDKARVDNLKTIVGEVSGVIGGLNQVAQNVSATELNNLESKYAKELELAAGNATEEARINEQLDREREKIEKKAFERQKKIQKATATISYLQGLINIATAPSTIPDPFGAIFKGVQAALLTGIYTSNLARINSTQFGKKGLLLMDQSKQESRMMAQGGAIRIGSFARGQSHGMGHITGKLNGQNVAIENREFVDKDEFGNIAVINKKNSQKFKRPLQRMAGKSFAGKSSILSGINSHGGHGIAFAQNGLSVPNLVGAFSGRSGGSVINNTMEFSPIQLEEIKNAVAAGAMTGSKEGTATGNIEANRELERENRLTQITG